MNWRFITAGGLSALLIIGVLYYINSAFIVSEAGATLPNAEDNLKGESEFDKERASQQDDAGVHATNYISEYKTHSTDTSLQLIILHYTTKDILDRYISDRTCVLPH